jgi:hypothetical protein
VDETSRVDRHRARACSARDSERVERQDESGSGAGFDRRVTAQPVTTANIRREYQSGTFVVAA